MSFSGGVYTLPGPALATGDTVSATENNQFRNDVAGAFNLTFLRNGTSTATANLPMGGHKLTGLGEATTSGDALSYGQTAVVSDITATGSITVNSGTANGVAYLNGSKVLTTGTDLVFNSTGLGIGTSSPAQKLDVTGNAAVSGQLMAGTTTAYSDGATGTPRIQCQAKSGIYVGAISIADTTSDMAHWVLRNPNGNVAAIGTNGTSLVISNPLGTERARIDSSGNLLVGTTSNSANGKVAIYGTWSGGSAAGISLSTTTATNAQALIFNNPNGAVGSINTNGSATYYITASDYRLKENIQPMQNALGVVAQLNPVTYTWKADGSDGQGFIAHELQAVVPACATGEKDAVDEEGNPVYQGIDTSFLVATLTKAIQELAAKIDAQQAEIDALKNAAA